MMLILFFVPCLESFILFKEELDDAFLIEEFGVNLLVVVVGILTVFGRSRSIDVGIIFWICLRVELGDF